MSSFEFYAATTFASCQYHAEDFFTAIQKANGDYPQLARAQNAFEALHDEQFSAADGETAALKQEIAEVTETLKIDLRAPAKPYEVFGLIAQQLTAVFAESQANETDIKFRWG